MKSISDNEQKKIKFIRVTIGKVRIYVLLGFMTSGNMCRMLRHIGRVSHQVYMYK